LQQVIRRIHEEQHLLEQNDTIIDDSMQLLMLHNQGPLINGCTSPQYKKIKTIHYCINIATKADRFVEMSDGTIVEVHNIACYKNSTVLLGYTFLEIGEFFKNPCSSTRFDIKVIIKDDCQLKTWNTSMINRKLVVLPHGNKFVCFPLLHN